MEKQIDWLSSNNFRVINSGFNRELIDKLDLLVKTFDSEFKHHLFVLTSGSSTKTDQDYKWVALSKEGFLSAAHAANRHLKSDSSDLWLHPLPNFHVGGLGILARSFLSGAKVISMGKWNSHKFQKVANENQITLSSLVPTQVYDLVQSKLIAPPFIRGILVGGGALSFSLYQKACSLGWPLLPTYGMTESSSQIATASLESVSNHKGINFGKKFIPLQLLPHLATQTDHNGYLQLKGTSVLSAYLIWNDEIPTRIDPKVEGWFTTQDRVEIQGQTLKVIGRESDFIKIGGESVYLGRLQNILDQIRMELAIMPDCVIVPVEDHRLGSCIVLISEEDLSQLQAEQLIFKFNQKVLGFEKIRSWKKVIKIPRTSLGKLILSKLAL